LIAIATDFHFGIRNNSPKYLEFQEKWFLKEFLPNIKECENTVILGDIVDSRTNISPIVLNTLVRLFKELSKVTTISCIVGNHDIYFRNNRSVHWLEIFKDIGVKVYDNPSEVIIDKKKCLMLPWVVPDDVKNVEKILTEQKFDICFGHLNINEFEMVKGVAENNGFPPSLFNNCKRVYSGHYHLARKKGNITYVGTGYELCWNDANEEKSFIILDGEYETKVVTKNTPKHIKINSDTTPLEKISKEMITNNIVRARIGKLEETERINYVEKLNSLFPLSILLDDEKSDDNFELDENLESNIRDTIGFLTEYINIIEVPDTLNKQTIIEKIELLYKKLG